MRYSAVLGTYYKIALSQPTADRVDTHFSAAAHHLRMREQSGGCIRVQNFHDVLMKCHCVKVLTLISAHGDFSVARDPSGEGRDKRASWDPRLIEVPEEDFEAMPPDPRFSLGEHHASDGLLYLPDDQQEAA